MTNTPDNPVDTRAVAIVLASHGDRGDDKSNAGLAAHVEALRESGQYRFVSGGVLNGEPKFESALAEAELSGAEWILVYPMFMSAGYFAAEELPRRIKAANVSVLTSVLQPLGVDQRAPLLMLESALRAAQSSGLNPAETRLLVVGHGSKQGSASADATRRAVRVIEGHSPFARIDTAFIEEAPFVADALREYQGPTIIAGFFAGDGMHSGQDIPDAIAESGATAIYAGPVGLHPRISELIGSSVARALKSCGAENEPARPQAAAPTSPDPAPPPDPTPSPDPTPAPQPMAAPAPEPAPAAGPASAPAHGETSPEKPRRSVVQALSSGTRGVRLILGAVVALVMLAVLGVAALAFLVPEDTVRQQLTSIVKQQTGRDLAIDGDISVAWFPSIGVELGDVRVSNPAGMTAGDTLQVGTLTVNLKLLPLISRRVEVDRFVLTKPVFNLLSDANGRKNWELEKKAAARTEPTGQPHNGPSFVHAQAAGIGGGAVQEIRLGKVEIVDGTVNFTDERAGTRQNVSALNVSLVQPQLSDPLDANGDLVWRDKKVTFEGRVDSPSALIRDEASKLRLGLSAPDAKADFDGNIRLGTAPEVNGRMTANTQSVRQLAQWVSDPLPPGGGLGPASFTGQLSLKDDVLKFQNAELGIDDMKGKGQGSIRLAGARPLIVAGLTLDKLDLNPYLGEAPSPGKPGTAAPKPRGTKPSAAEPAPKPQSGQSLTDFIKKLDKAEEAPGAPQVRGWSKRAFDLSGLRSVDANVKLTAGTILYRQIRTGQSALTAALKNGVLTADLTRFALYSGTGVGRVTVNGARKTPAMAAVFNLNGVSALPFLTDAADFDWISGRANIELKVSGAGRSQKAMMQDLQGAARVAFADGAIEGINIPAMVRGLKQGKIDGWKRADREKTDFSQLSASFVIQKGVARNKDLQLIGPLVRMTGEGDIDLGRERIDYTALPRLVANLQGQGAVDDPKRGLLIPVRITGPLADPKIVPDLNRILNDPELAKDTVEKVGEVFKKLKNKEDVNNLLQGVFGGGDQQAPDGTQPQGEQARPEDVLRNLLGR